MKAERVHLGHESPDDQAGINDEDAHCTWWSCGGDLARQPEVIENPLNHAPLLDERDKPQAPSAATSRVRGLHVFTMNQVASTAAWQKRMLEELQGTYQSG